MKKFNIDWKAILPYAVAIVVFIGVAVIYCSPLLNGKVLQAGDVNNWKGAAQEAREFKQQTGETTWWTNSMFGGMPTYQITGSTPTNIIRGKLEKIAHFGFFEDLNPIGIIAAYFFGFFLLLLCFGVNPWLSLVGGLAMGLSSYFFLIIPAGHITKAVGLGFLAPMIGGFYAIFRKRYWLGAPLVTIYGILGITLHPQMTYYICMLLGVMAIAELYIHISEKRWKDLGMGVGILLICGLLIFGTKLSWWQMNQTYLKETMRGEHSELVKETDATNKTAGLDLDYATAWSYGINETMTFLIPNYMGGASGYNLGNNSLLEEELKQIGVPARQAKGFCQSAPTYWGEKPFTSGPVYMGAIIVFLFVLGLIIVPGPYKWALLIATLFSVALAWGRHFMPLTEFFFNYFPMYNKFRAVESILVVAEITMPLLGFLALQRLTAQRSNSDSGLSAAGGLSAKRAIFIAAGITAGICLIFALFGGSICSFTSSYDEQWKGQVGNKIYQMIIDQRAAMLKADAWRSFILIALAAAALLVYLSLSAKRSNSEAVLQRSGLTGKAGLYAVLGILILLDMVPVNRCFFDADNFISKKEDNRYFAMQPWEEQILKDKSLDYRVLNVAANTFNDARTSYRLKSIGGYSAAKLRRYQDLIDEHISQNNWQVINMLNTKYIITHNGVQLNPEAFGNAWFVDKVHFVDTPNAESDALNTLDLRHEAVIDTTLLANSCLLPSIIRTSALESDRKLIGSSSESSLDMIELTEYQPNRLTYRSTTEKDRVCVFSEIYYPYDWHLYIDGEEQPIGRANYTLRTAVIPAGQHEIVMEFVPAALKTDRWCMAILIIAMLLSLAGLGYLIVSSSKASR
ncbi:MAG: YfhO family protein [Paludibacteraceae bacterium]|nr:YfhO family protein [Paludibacteraceae bacterium]